MSGFFKEVHIDRETRLKNTSKMLCERYQRKSNRYVDANRTDMFAKYAMMNYNIKIIKYCERKEKKISSLRVAKIDYTRH